MNIRLSIKIFPLFLFILFSGYALVSSIVDLNTKEKELKKSLKEAYENSSQSLSMTRPDEILKIEVAN